VGEKGFQKEKKGVQQELKHRLSGKRTDDNDDNDDIT
jgi:hypothetical protein